MLIYLLNVQRFSGCIHSVPQFFDLMYEHAEFKDESIIFDDEW